MQTKHAYAFILSTIITLHAAPQRLNLETLNNYVQHYVDALFAGHQNNREVKEIARNVADAITNNNNLCKWDWFEWQCKYDPKEVQEAIHAYVVDHIEQEVRHIAYDYTHDHETIERLVKHFSNEATRILTQYGNINGKFASFLHEKLKQSVWRQKEQFDKQKREEQAYSQLYASDSCCVCMEDFDDVQRIFLSPCGHDICARCAYQWFFSQRKSSCPHCRSTVDINRLREALR